LPLRCKVARAMHAIAFGPNGRECNRPATIILVFNSFLP